MSFLRKKSRPKIKESLRSLRARVIAEGTPFFRVIAESGELSSFWAGSKDFETREQAEEVALDCASLNVGCSFFVSERYKLDGVQVQVSCKEFCFSFLEGLNHGK